MARAARKETCLGVAGAFAQEAWMLSSGCGPSPGLDLVAKTHQRRQRQSLLLFLWHVQRVISTSLPSAWRMVSLLTLPPSGRSLQCLISISFISNGV